MNCSNCGGREIVCNSCLSHSGLRGWIEFTLEELDDLECNLGQCVSEGYLQPGDAAYQAFEKILTEIKKLEKKDEE